MLELNINDKNIIVNMEELKYVSSIFGDLMRKVENLFLFLQFGVKDSYLYYKRNSNAKSVLAIQVSNGNFRDQENYMINFSKCLRNNNVIISEEDMHCNVGFQAEVKSSKRAMMIANYLAKDIVKFFEQMEYTLWLNNQTNLEMEILIPLKIWRRENIVERILRKIEKRG